jgi:hypothetical protein
VSSADQTARALRRQIRSEPGAHVVATRDELIAALRANGSSASDHDLDPGQVAQAVLVHHGIDAAPRLPDAEPDSPVELRLTPRYAIQGAIALTALATVVGFVGRPLYGLVLALAGGSGFAILMVRGEWVERSAPRWIPRGRILGASVAAVPALIATLVVILPLRAHYRHTSNAGNAAALVRQADAAVDKGDFDTAKRKLFEAESSAPNPPAIDDVRAHLVVAQVQAIIDDAARNDAIYDAAVRAFRAGHDRRAIALMKSIRGWKDSDARARAFRRGQPG